MASCVLCGRDVNFLSQKVIHLCSTEQPLCGDCWKEYDRADKVEQSRLRDRMLTSPNLKKREQVQEFLAANRESMLRRDRENEEARQRADFLREHMTQKLRCCDSPMEYLGEGGYTQYPLGLYISATTRLVDVFECPVCGQVKFFNPDFVPAALREKEKNNG